MRLFVPDKDFGERMRDSEGFRSGLRAIGEQVKAATEPNVRSAGGPWMPSKEGREPVEVHEDQDGVYVTLTDHGGHLMEYGSAKSPVHAPLRRGAQAVGLRIDESF